VLETGRGLTGFPAEVPNPSREGMRLRTTRNHGAHKVEARRERQNKNCGYLRSPRDFTWGCTTRICAKWPG
jgi:hypothetical protein